MADDNVALARRWFEEVWNQGRTATIEELFAADGRMHGIGSGGDVVHGPAGFRAHYDQLKGAFPDIRFTIEEAIAERDMVAVRWTATATHQGDHLGMPATNKPVTITGMGFARIRDGKIVETWNNWDMMGLMHTIGQSPHAKVL
jgi:steroid delta-isomerase-like uncharacterized protein